MNIYFACSITGGREYERIYQDLTAALLADGHTIPTARLADSNVVLTEEAVSPREVYERDVIWMRAADALIAEVSVPSHGVGYEIGFALNAGKPVLCLYQDGRKISKMIGGNPHPNLLVEAYKDVGEAIKLAKNFLEGIQS
ncbi:MAG: nucleoside 2-deoxyribosyltransferase [Chloroflexi bacterium]|nr:nucleoside 2-deoxyribosyltransferase [Chloroflexota bacterium]MBI1855414.1 nucleoside 2-deoxyribosyltransferase [Chloroflexota bacterium]MBI2757350.1 nucleoside 2-deoxyribosyltransferase [Chloroflexota bacterium]MBI3340044.1 nucleoside 2-deoxyribosyltransferase [Chloroflexota bacterium]